MFSKAWPIAVSLVWLAAGPVQAQDAAEPAPATEATDDSAALLPTAEQILQAAADKLRPPSIPRPCPVSESGVIVVCAQDDSAQRVASTTDEAIAAGQSVGDGVPRAPDVFGIPNGGVSIPIGSAPEPVLMIDLKAIPEAPAGSDAARYAEEAEREAARSAE